MEIKNNSGYIKKGQHLSPDTEFKKGHIPASPFKKGCISLNKKEPVKISCAMCGKIFNVIPSRAKTAKYCSRGCQYKSRIGAHRTEEDKKRISLKLKGIKHTPQAIENYKKASVERWKNDSYRKSRTKENHFNWKGGTSFEPYPQNWDRKLKDFIRKRDNNMCQICNKKCDNEILSVHHIDYNKFNCQPNNLISLCRSCHTKTNYDREKWIIFFRSVYGNTNN
jgi:hypothetical protein